MNTFLAAGAAALSSGHSESDDVRTGAYSSAPMKLMADNQWRTLFPWLRNTSRAMAVGQGSTTDFLSVTAYACDQPTGADQATVTPIYTPQLYDSYMLSIDGSPLGLDLTRLEISPGASTAIGVKGQGGVPLPFMNRNVIGPGLLPVQYGGFDLKIHGQSNDKHAPLTGFDPDIPAHYLLEVADTSPGTLYRRPGGIDKVVRRDLLSIYIGDGTRFAATPDIEGYTPLEVHILPGGGLSFVTDPAYPDTKALIASGSGTGGSGAFLPGIGIEFRPGLPPQGTITLTPQLGTGVDPGPHQYCLVGTTSFGDTALGPPFSVIADSTDGVILVAYGAQTDPAITAIKLYRTKVGGSVFYQVPGWTTSIGSVSAVDNTPDSGLLSPPSTSLTTIDSDIRAGFGIQAKHFEPDTQNHYWQIDALASDLLSPGIGIEFRPGQPLPTPPALVLQAVSGSLGHGVYTYWLVYVTSDGNTNPGPSATVTTSAGNEQVQVTAPTTSDPSITATLLYRSVLNGSDPFNVGGWPGGASGQVYVDNTADGSLGLGPTIVPMVINADIRAGANVTVTHTEVDPRTHYYTIASTGGGGGSFTAGLNIDPTQLSSNVIATKFDVGFHSVTCTGVSGGFDPLLVNTFQGGQLDIRDAGTQSQFSADFKYINLFAPTGTSPFQGVLLHNRVEVSSNLGFVGAPAGSGGIILLAEEIYSPQIWGPPGGSSGWNLSTFNPGNNFDMSTAFGTGHFDVRVGSISLTADGDIHEASNVGNIYLDSSVIVTGNMVISGSISKGSGSFRIDHPLDPENKYLQHSFVESPDVMNIYNGIVDLSSGGEAWVTMPDWFEALNQDFRYQLTPIGKSMPDLYVHQEIKNLKFLISGGKPFGRVSWQVTGIRHDKWILEHPIEVELPKRQ